MPDGQLQIQVLLPAAWRVTLAMVRSYLLFGRFLDALSPSEPDSTPWSRPQSQVWGLAALGSTVLAPYPARFGVVLPTQNADLPVRCFFGVFSELQAVRYRRASRRRKLSRSV
jgi:hypothetical protein